MTANPPRDPDLLDLQRQAFLLDQVNSAKNGKLSRTEANKRIPKQIQDELKLGPSAANDLRTSMTSHGLLTDQPSVKRSVSYSITEAGRAWLRQHQWFIPLLPVRGKANASPNATVHAWRVAYLLLQLVDAPEGGQTPSELNKRPGPKMLNLDAATARMVRGELLVRQWIVVSRKSRSEKYILTPAGQFYLALCETALTGILQSARNGTIASPIPEAVTKPIPQPTTVQLEAAVMEISAELRRELNTKLVPIHRVRAHIRHQYGEKSASRDVFDEILLGLRRSKKVRLISISDKSEATPEQLRESIVSVGETFFYLENIDESPSS